MAGEDSERTRRMVLRALGGTGVLSGLAGCNALGGATDSTETESTTGTEHTTAGPSATISPTATATPDEEPRIVTYSATPKQHGERLAVSLEATDDSGLGRMYISYGDREHSESPNGTTGTIEAEFETTDVEIERGPGEVVFAAVDQAGQETQRMVVPDEIGPLLRTYQVGPTASAGEVAATVEAEDETGLKTVSVQVGDTIAVERTVSGQREVTLDRTIDLTDTATSGELHTVTTSLEDWNGNTRAADAETYLRKYDVVADSETTFSAVYIPFLGTRFWDALPEGYHSKFGRYRMSNNAVVNRQIDLMQGHGIEAIQFNYADSQNQSEFENFMDVDLARSEIHLEPLVFGWRFILGKDGAFRTVLAENIEYVRAEMLSRDTAATVGERPIVTFWDIHAIAWDGGENPNAVRQTILDEWGSFTDFIRYLRESLTLSDGTEPYFVGDVHNNIGSDGTYPSDYAEINAELDALTTWIPVRGGENSWTEVLERVRTNFERTSLWAKSRGKGFIPTVFPGYEAADTDGYGGDSHLSRNVQRFEQMLTYARKYKTDTPDRINIATWNDYVEGHQIEPGTWNGHEYGTAYLDVIKRFQRGELT